MTDLSKLSANILASLKSIAAGDGVNKEKIDSQSEFDKLNQLLSKCENQDDYDCILGLKISYQNMLKKEANFIANEFYQIADDNFGRTSVIKISALIDKKINANNIVAILDAYQNPEIRHDDSSMIDTITSEIGASAAEQREALTKIINVLCEAAKNAGVSESDITNAKNSFITSMNKELGAHFRRTNPKDMEKAVDFLKGAILAKQNEVANVDEDTAMQAIAQNYQSQNAQASEKFETAREKEGWTAKTGDWVCGLFGCNTEDELRAKLGDNAQKVEKLVSAANSGNKEEFKKVYKKLFGIEFDANKIAASEEYQERYLTAANINETNKAIDEILHQNLDYNGAVSFLKEKFKYDDETINQIMLQYNQPMGTETEKLALLKQFLVDTIENYTQELKYLTQGESLEQMANKAELLAKAAFGTNDIAKDVTQFNENMQTTEMITDAAFEIAGTIALQFVPGLGQAAAVKLAASAAKWGARGYKIAQGALKVGKGFESANRLLTGQRFTSKAAQKGMQIGTQMFNSGTATAAVEFSSGKDMETAVKKIVMNMSFAGVGATSNMIAPKLVQAFGIESQFATEIAEELINAAGSYGVCTAAGDEYGSTDFWTDMATGLIISRLVHIKGRKKNDVPTQTQQSKNLENTTDLTAEEIQRQAKIREITSSDENYAKYIDETFGKNPKLAQVRERLAAINKEFGTKILLPDNLSEVGNAAKEIYNELTAFKMRANAIGAKANYPEYIDFNYNSELKRRSFAAGYDEDNNFIAIQKMTVDDIRLTLRHELTHANNLKLNVDKFLQDFDPYKFADEFLDGGVEARHVSYAFHSKQEFLAVAAEGNMRNYSPELKQALEELGMPKWMLEINSPYKININPTARDREIMQLYVDMSKIRNERLASEDQGVFEINKNLKDRTNIKGYTIEEIEAIYQNILPPNSKMTIDSGLIDLSDLKNALEIMSTPYDIPEIIEARKQSLQAGRLKINSKSKILKKDPITNSILEDAAIQINQAIKDKKLVIVAGGAASGKSTYLTKNLYDMQHGYFLADADLIKMKLPGYKEFGSTFVHTPSASLVRAELHMAIEQGCNIAYPTVGRKAIEEAIEIAQKNGYSDIQIVYCNIPKEIRAQRAINRFLNEPTHRFVDPYYILQEENILTELQEYSKTYGIKLVITS